MTVPTVLMNKKHNSTDHWLAQHCMLDKTDQKHNMQRKKQRDSCLDQRVPRSVMLKRLCKYDSEAPVLSRRFPYQEMPSEIRAVTDANWAGNWRDGARRRFTLVIICWRRIRRRSRLWRCQLQRIHLDNERVSLTLWRSDVLWFVRRTRRPDGQKFDVRDLGGHLDTTFRGWSSTWLLGFV